MYFYSLVKHHCIFLYKLVKIEVQCDSVVVITAVPEKGTPALCGSLSDREFVSKTGRAGSGEKEERMGMGEAGPARRGEMRQWEPAGRQGLEQTAVKDQIQPVKIVQNALMPDSAAPADVLPVSAFTGLLPAFPFPKATWPKEGAVRLGGEQGDRNGARAQLPRGKKDTSLKSFRSSHSEGRKMALWSPRFPPSPSLPS